MKVFITVDDQQIVRCVASEICNIHEDKRGMAIHYVEKGGTVGDEYNVGTDTWTPHPENYPQPSQEQIYERKITEKQKELQREAAVSVLKAEGELPADYKETQ